MGTDYDFDVIDQLIDQELYGIRPKLSRDASPRSRRSDRQESTHSRQRRSRSRSHNRDKRHRSDSSDVDRSRSRGKPGVEERRRPEHERSQREDCSIMVMGLHPQVGDREVYEFFSKEAGKVRDVYVIRDQRTGKSKGVSYVEFYLSDSVLKALACNGRTIKGLPIRVQASGAEKNRAAQAQKAAQVERQERPITLYIMGMNGPLSAMDENDLKQIFGPFGDIDYVNIGRCPYTGRNRGFAHLQFSRAADARDAMACLNNIDIGGYVLQVGYLTRSLESSHTENRRRPPREDDSEYIRSNEQRTRVMNSLMMRGD
jgi:RNA-binding protein 39